MHALKEVLGENFAVNNDRVRPGPRTLFSDLEVIALSCTSEYLGYTSENHLFSLIDKTDFPNLLSRRQYNDRRKFLLNDFESIRRKIFCKITHSIKNAFVIDSMPLKVCRMARRYRNKVGKDGLFGFADIGFCAAQDEWYFGFKLHATCTLDGVLATVDFTPASVHDVNYLKDISYTFQNCDIIGDKGYVSQPYKTLLMERSNIRLLTETRKNQKVIDFIPKEYKGKRKKIETIFSQLTDQFSIQKNYTKSAAGYFSRILSKITSMTVMNYINVHTNNVSASKIKYALA